MDNIAETINAIAMTNEELFTEAARIFRDAAELLSEHKRAETIEKAKRFERWARQERDGLPEYLN